MNSSRVRIAKSGSNSKNDGNIARRIYQNPDLSADLTDIFEELTSIFFKFVLICKLRTKIVSIENWFNQI